MMANGWRTPKEIQKDYDITDKTWSKWRIKCEATPYRDAIVRISQKTTYVIESRWQEFLKSESEKYRERTLDPHIRNN